MIFPCRIGAHWSTKRNGLRICTEIVLSRWNTSISHRLWLLHRMWKCLCRVRRKSRENCKSRTSRNFSLPPFQCRMYFSLLWAYRQHRFSWKSYRQGWIHRPKRGHNIQSVLWSPLRRIIVKSLTYHPYLGLLISWLLVSIYRCWHFPFRYH